jgi:hypothetical protein
MFDATEKNSAGGLEFAAVFRALELSNQPQVRKTPSWFSRL